MSFPISRRKILQLAMVPPFIRLKDLAPDPTTTLVYPGGDGKLVYERDAQGNTIPDFSYAGYKGGGVRLPTVPVRETIWPVAGDNTAHVQAAIDKVSSRTPDASGFRGALLLRAGYYRMATPLRIQASGVVLRGEGMGDTGTVLIGTGTGRPAGGAGGPGPGNQGTLVLVGGASGVAPQDATTQAVTDDYVPVGSRRFRVASGAGFRPGDAVLVRRIGNQAWIDAIGMNLDTPGGRWRPFNIEFDRVVTE